MLREDLMSDPVPFFLSVPNSNPESAFASFEITACWEFVDPRTNATEVMSLDDFELAHPPAEHGPVFYTLYGRFDPDKNPQHFGGVQAISNFTTVSAAKELLVALNGPIDEGEDD